MLSSHRQVLRCGSARSHVPKTYAPDLCLEVACLRTDSGIVGLPYEAVDTPSLLLDLDALDRNIRRMAEFFSGVRATLRPHFKTHKTPIIARKQIEAGARGITCAKLSECEVLVASG